MSPRSFSKHSLSMRELEKLFGGTGCLHNLSLKMRELEKIVRRQQGKGAFVYDSAKSFLSRKTWENRFISPCCLVGFEKVSR